MTLEEQITELLAQAEHLRGFPDDEAEAKGLPRIVDQINVLRAEQARDPFRASEATLEGADSVDYQAIEDRMWPSNAGEHLPAPVIDGSMHAATLAFAGDAQGLHELQQRNLKRKPGRPRKAD